MATEPTDVTLNIFVDEDGVAFSITKSNGFARFGRTVVARQELERIANTARQLELDAARSDQAVAQLSERIFAQLIPAPIASILQTSSAQRIALQVPPELLHIPWDLAFNGHALMPRRMEVTLLASADGDAAADTVMPIASFRERVERQEPDHQRQVTIMSYDLVESTRLLATLGSEAYTDLLESFHASCASIVTRWGGVASDPQGNDGLMCYFGLPVAQEDAAANALRAALDIVEAVARLSVRVRLGIVTGPVVVKARQPVGVAIHLAARLQSIAEPGTVVVSESTRSIVRRQFEFEPLQRVQPLKGFDDPGTSYRLLGPRRKQEEGDGQRPNEIGFVGRHEELSALLAHWDQVHRGSFRSLMLRGEAGIGKSRLVREFRRELEQDQHRVLECRCVSEQSISPFYPLLDLMTRRLQLESAPDDRQRVQSMADGMGNHPERELYTAVLAPWLGVSSDLEHLLEQVSAEKQRQLTLEALLCWLTHAANSSPLCLVVEDLHWADPSTLELLRLLLSRSPSVALFVLLTQRVDAAHGDALGPRIPALELRGFNSQTSLSMIQEACRGVDLPTSTMQALCERSDGVPLFIEESVRMVLEGARGARQSGSAATDLAIPTTLHDLLMARLDRMGEAKQLAQLASLIGREFSEAVLLAVLADEEQPMQMVTAAAGLARLVEAGILMRKAQPASTLYFFRHALIRDAAGQSLLGRDRRRCHAVIAKVLLEQFAGSVLSQPQNLAQHFALAGDSVRAVAYWEQAARLAMRRSAHAETTGYLERALALVQVGMTGPDRLRAELRLQLMLAGQSLATQGYGAALVGLTYQRALELSQALNDERSMLKVLLGLEAFHFMRADFDKAHEMARQVQLLLARADDPVRSLQARWAVANILFHQGDLVQAVRLMDQCLVTYREQGQVMASVQDPGVMCLCYSALAQWELGHADDAMRRANEAIALAESLQHKFSQAEAQGFAALVHYYRGEFAAGLQAASRALALCEEGGYAVWLAHAKVMHGRMLAQEGDRQVAIREIEEGYALWVGSGAQVTRPLYLALLAEALALDGRTEEALHRVEEALALVDAHSERYYEPELHRLAAELDLQLHGPLRVEVRRRIRLRLEHALTLAEIRQLSSLVQKVNISLGRLNQLEFGLPT